VTRSFLWTHLDLTTPGAGLARATGRLAKTDAIDAQVLAHFAELIQPPTRPLPDEQSRELTALVCSPTYPQL
jgi:transposase